MVTVTPEQYAYLTQPVDAKRVQQLRGQSHMEAWDIRRTLIRTFGFGGFDIETKALDLVAQIQHTVDKDGKPIPDHKPRWTVVYRAEVRLTVKAADGRVIGVYEDGASGDSQNQPSLGDAHDQAMKTALSQGLKRCAVNLGDQFGLSLYNNGKTDPVVYRTLNAPAGEVAQPADLPVEQVLPEQTPAVEQAVDHPRVAVLTEKIGWCNTKEHLAVMWKELLAAAKAGELPDGGLKLLQDRWEIRRDTIKATARLFALLSRAEIVDRDERLHWYCNIVGREISSTNDLTLDEINKVAAKTEAWIDQKEPATAGAAA